MSDSIKALMTWLDEWDSKLSLMDNDLNEAMEHELGFNFKEIRKLQVEIDRLEKVNLNLVENIGGLITELEKQNAVINKLKKEIEKLSNQGCVI